MVDHPFAWSFGFGRTASRKKIDARRRCRAANGRLSQTSLDVRVQIILANGIAGSSKAPSRRLCHARIPRDYHCRYREYLPLFGFGGWKSLALWDWRRPRRFHVVWPTTDQPDGRMARL